MSEVVTTRAALVSTSRTVTVAPGTPAPLESLTVPAIDPVMPWPNELGVSPRASVSSRTAKRTAHQIGLFAGGTPVLVVCFGVSNKVFIGLLFGFAGRIKNSESNDLMGLVIFRADQLVFEVGPLSIRVPVG